MSSYNKQKGTKFETDVLKYLRKLGHFAERLALTGKDDQGDIVTIIAGKTYILECKNRKTLNLPAFWDEAQAEAKNYAKARGMVATPPAFVIVKKRRGSVEDAWVIQTLEKWIEQMPVPQGDITSSEINNPQPEDVQLPEDPTEVEEKEEEREDLAAYDAAMADPEPGVPLEEIDWKEE